MVDVPQQDWQFYEARTRVEDAEWLRELSTQDRFALYEGLMDVIGGARHVHGDWERLDRWQWDQKVATRKKLFGAYCKLDQLQRERTAANNPG